MNEIDISVLVVCFNHEKYIERALASISSQLSSYSIEVVVADDASTDGTLKIVRHWQRNTAMNVRILDPEPNLGITKNYERAIRACSGRFIAVLEGDDEWLSVEKLELQAQFLDDHDDIVVVANRLLQFDEATGESVVWPLIGADHHWTRITSEQLAEMNWFGTFSTCMFRTSALKSVPGEVFEETSYDWMINMAITMFGDGALLPQVTALYRSHSGGVWSSQSTPERDLKMQTLVPRYMELLSGRLDRQLSAVLQAVEGRLAKTTPEQLIANESVAKHGVENAPLICIPRVTSGLRPRVSVVMTCENNAKHIGSAIETVLQQTMRDFEFIVVDQSSSDRSRELIARVTDSRVRAYSLTETVATAAALNIAIQQARGEFVAVVGAEDLWEPHKLERQLQVFEEKPRVAAVFTGARIVNENGLSLESNRIPRWMGVFRQPNRSQGQWLRYFLANGNPLCLSSALIKREIFKDIGMFDGSLKELSDIDRWIALVKHSPIEVIGEEPLVRFRTSHPVANDVDHTPGNIVRTYHERMDVNQRFFDGVTSELLVDGFADILRQRFLRTTLEIKCATAFLWLDCEGPLQPVNRAQALAELHILLRDSSSELYLQTQYGVRDTFVQELAKVTEGARTFDSLQSLGSFRLTPERQIIYARSSGTFFKTIQGARNTPLRKWPRLIRRRLLHGR